MSKGVQLHNYVANKAIASNYTSSYSTKILKVVKLHIIVRIGVNI